MQEYVSNVDNPYLHPTRLQQTKTGQPAYSAVSKIQILVSIYILFNI